ncbi:MAG: hypothetical protein IPM20_06515 [Gammaproteobacteria bacterium]|nr:hypothetical protein [Gammaproteobacteria bacterium]
MLHRFTRLLVVLSLLMPLGATPLGLGDITLHSALNQPLDAKIDLTALGQTRGEEITVALASPAAFESAGLDRSLALVSLKFEVVAEDGGAPYIRVSSTDPIKEPFLDFLVEIDWPSGHLLREYTLLLDPPVVVDEEPLPVQSAVAGEEAVVSAPAPVVFDEPVSAPESPAGQPMSGAGILTFGPVQRSDTLWSIASQMQQADPDATVEQVMMALLKNNPDAFYNENINELKAGYILRVSDPGLLTAMSRAAAAAEVRRQNEQWMDSKQSRAGMAGATPQGMPEAGPGDVAGAGGGDAGPRLRLSVPEATATGMALEGVAGEGEGNSSPQTEVARLKNELAAALETSEASRQENTELRERLATLQEQIDAMQRLTTLQDDTLAALQAGAGAPAAEAEPAPASAKDATEGGKPADVAAAKPARKPEAPARQSAGGGLLDDPNILTMGGVAALAVLVMAWLIMRRRRRSAALLEELAAADAASEARDDISPPAWAAVTPQPAVAPAAPQQDTPAAETAEAEDTGLDLMQADDDEIDVLAEADVYLAYRRFDKAEELLKEAIKGDSNRKDLVLKLLEVQAASGNKGAFIVQAESFRTMLGSGDSTLWDKVVVMGRRIAPDHVLFGGAATTVAAAAMTAGAAHATESAGPDLGGDDLGNELPVLELDADIATELDKLAGADDEAQAAGHADEASPLMDMDLSLDDAVVAETAQDGLNDPAGEETPADSAPQHAGSFGNASNVINFGSRAGVGQGAPGLPQEDAADASTGAGTSVAGLDRDLDWLTGGDEEFGSLDDAEGDDFSSLISGEDEVGTKLDLAKAYIDMGDQESARNILSEVAQEGSQDQQREANDLMRQIG